MRSLAKKLGSRWGAYTVVLAWLLIISSLWGGTQPGPGIAIAVIAAAILTVFGAWARLQDE